MTSTTIYPTRGAVTDAILTKYLAAFRMRKGAGLAIVRKLFIELRQSVDKPLRARGFTLEDLRDQTVDRNGQPASDGVVKAAMRTLEANLLAFQGEIDRSRFIIVDTPHRIDLRGPTAAARGDDDVDHFWLRADFRPLAEAGPGQRERLGPAPVGDVPAEIQALLQRCAIFRGAFTSEQAAFVLDLQGDRLAALAAGGVLNEDPITGRYSVRPDLFKEARAALLTSDEEFTILASLHGAYFAYLNLRRLRGEVTEFTPTDLEHLRDARQYFSPDFSETLLSLVLGNVPTDLRPAYWVIDGILRLGAERTEACRAYDAATRLHALRARFTMLDMSNQYVNALTAFRKFLSRMDPVVWRRCSDAFDGELARAAIENLDRYDRYRRMVEE